MYGTRSPQGSPLCNFHLFPFWAWQPYWANTRRLEFEPLWPWTPCLFCPYGPPRCWGSRLLGGRGTSQDVDEIVETDTTISLISFFEGSLKFAVLGSGEDAPFLVEELFEVEPWFSMSSGCLLVCQHIKLYFFKSNNDFYQLIQDCSQLSLNYKRILYLIKKNYNLLARVIMARVLQGVPAFFSVDWRFISSFWWYSSSSWRGTPLIRRFFLHKMPADCRCAVSLTPFFFIFALRLMLIYQGPLFWLPFSATVKNDLWQVRVYLLFMQDKEDE